MSLVKICWEQRKYQSSIFNPNFLFLIKLLFRHHLEESWQCRPGYLRSRILSINSSRIDWQNSKVDTHCKTSLLIKLSLFNVCYSDRSVILIHLNCLPNWYKFYLNAVVAPSFCENRKAFHGSFIHEILSTRQIFYWFFHHCTQFNISNLELLN